MKKLKVIGNVLLCYFVGSFFLWFLIDFHNYSYTYNDMWLGLFLIFDCGFRLENLLIFLVVSMIIISLICLSFFINNKYDKILLCCFAILFWFHAGLIIFNFKLLFIG
jgi:hypothetical protein